MSARMGWGWGVAVWVAAGCSPGGACELAPSLSGVAGAGAVQCGPVAYGADPTAASACAVAAQRAGRAFWFAEYLQGTDSEVATGIVLRSDGAAYQFGWDSDPSGGGQQGGTLSQARCRALTIAVVDGRERVQCVDPTASVPFCGR